MARTGYSAPEDELMISGNEVIDVEISPLVSHQVGDLGYICHSFRAFKYLFCSPHYCCPNIEAKGSFECHTTWQLSRPVNTMFLNADTQQSGELHFLGINVNDLRCLKSFQAKVRLEVDCLSLRGG
jgi:hypothetical protein